MNTGVADKVVELRNEHPTMKAIALARQVRVSRERVRQILKKRGLPTRFVITPRRCFRCGREYQSRSAVSKYCPDCRVAVNTQRSRFCTQRRQWEQQKKARRYRCIFCQGVFGNAVEFSRHRVDTGELSDPDFRKWVITFRSTHSYWKTLDYFHISQETYKAIRHGKETTKHH